MKCKFIFKIFLLLIFSTILFSCNKYKEIFEDIKKIKITVYIWEENFIDYENYYIEIFDIAEIKNITKFISNVSSPSYKCGYNGKIDFYCKDNNVLFDAEFNIGCDTIVFIYDNKVYHKRISNDGIIYFENIIKNIEERYNKKNMK